MMRRRFKMFLSELLMGKLWRSTREQIEQAIVPGSGGIAFIGDSITHMGKWDLLFPEVPIRNFGIGGERSDHLLARTGPVIAMQPRKLFILIGTNDLACGFGSDEIAANVDALLAELRRALPHCRLYLHSVMPRSRGYTTRIRALNDRLRAVAKDWRAAYVDLWPLLDDGTGQIRAEFTWDNLHLNGAGYIAWRNALKPLLLESDLQ